MIQAAYDEGGWANLIKAPQNRAEMVRPAIEKLGGKLISSYIEFGDYDVLVLVEMPDNVAVAAAAMAFAGGGALKAVKTTPLLTWEQGVQAMRKAGGTGYRQAKPRAKKK
jgi:uncharacterized protein with GYD domain